ncbi:MAG TPA: hypothetical protein VI757_13275 [Bacteroidia bacterium]|nr:hypothetical protein [Bacteroidia bacterium]
MVSYNLKFKRFLKRLRNKQKLALIEAANILINSPEESAHYSSLLNEADNIKNAIEYFQTEHYKIICDSLKIPMPDLEDSKFYYRYNFDDDEGDKYILTKEGLYDVRDRIRKEKKERREIAGFWISMIIGLLGTLIGLISVIKN